MHFFYLDESGDTGKNLNDLNQPIFVLGGISVRDQGWNSTKESLDHIYSEFFKGSIPQGFELHSHELLCSKGEGPFGGFSLESRLDLARNLFKLLIDRSHDIHLFGIHKEKLSSGDTDESVNFDTKTPYLVAFDYLITYINWHVKTNLGSSSRALLILDEKTSLNQQIEKAVHARRFLGPKTHRVKWIVEFSYAIDSKKNPMVQLSDLVVLCARRFFEIEEGYRDDWPNEVKRFYAECYSIINERIRKKGMVERTDKPGKLLNDLLSQVRSAPKGQWKRRYGVQ